MHRATSIRRAPMAVAWTFCAIAAAGTAWAVSNPAFKLRSPLLAATPGGVSKSGTNTLGLPYRLKPGMSNAKDLMDDIGFSFVSNVQRYVAATNTLQTYTGRKGGGQAFPLVPGEGYYVKMNTTVTYTIVGTEDRAAQVVLRAADGGATSLYGVTLFAPPYDLVAGDAKALMDDIGFSSVADVQRFATATDGLQVYTGRKGSGPNFPIVRGEAYFIKMNTTVNYAPSRY